jgi:hypothetical protein
MLESWLAPNSDQMLQWKNHYQIPLLDRVAGFFLPGANWKIIFLAGCTIRSKGPVENTVQMHYLIIKLKCFFPKMTVGKTLVYISRKISQSLEVE